MFFPIEIVASPRSLSWLLELRKQVFISFSFEKLLSALATDIGQ